MRALNQSSFAVLILLVAPPAMAEPEASGSQTDQYDFYAHGETYVELFCRALLPGPRGAIVRTETLAPIHQYVLLNVSDLDAAWRNDSIDLELAAWGGAGFGEGNSGELFSGDVHTAFFGYRHGPLRLRFGRQLTAGGAARYSRFDGIAAEAELGEGFDARAYAGWTVLPRWNERPSYEYLGAAADSELRDPDALPEPERSNYWLAGGRFGFRSKRAESGVSFHEQHETGGLTRRDLGLDARAEIASRLSGAANAILDLDAQRFADARLWLDFAPTEAFEASVEALHTEPALFLSRQSVLSVFSSAGYDELGGSASARVLEPLTLEGGSWLHSYPAARIGSRSEATARLHVDRSGRLVALLTYTRLIAPTNGYHALRTALSRRLLPMLTSSLEAYWYVYDEAIRGVDVSTVYAGTLSIKPSEAFSALWGASLTRSPYARVDAQTQIRLTYDFDLGPGRERP
jgi:hypothetical protein